MKRLLLLSTIFFSLVIAGCGDNNNKKHQPGDDQTTKTATLDEVCTPTQRCVDGLVCVPDNNNPTENKCKYACDDAGGCSESNMECVSFAADEENAEPVEYCQEESEDITFIEMGILGDECNDTDKICAPDLVCVATLGDPTNRTCQETCNTDGDCTDSNMECIHLIVDIENPKAVSFCQEKSEHGTPTPTIAEGDECKEGDVCAPGTFCIARNGEPDIGFCTKATDCSKDKSVCNAPDVCEEGVKGLKGETYSLCNFQRWCTNYEQCDSNKECLRDNFGETMGHCKAVCDPKVSSNCPDGQTCTDMGAFTVGYWNPDRHRGLCIPDEEAAKPDLWGSCTQTNDCRNADKGIVCAEVKDSNAKMCAIGCNSVGYSQTCTVGGISYCFEWDNNEKACGEPVLWGDKYNTQNEGEPCGLIAPDKLALCKDTDHTYCVLENAGDTKGRCVKYDEKRCYTLEQCSTDKTCTEVVSKGLIYGNPDALSVCKEKSDKELCGKMSGMERFCTDPNSFCVLKTVGRTNGYCENFADPECSTENPCVDTDKKCTEIIPKGGIYKRTEGLSICRSQLPIEEGKDCLKDDTCISGTYCLKKLSSDYVGICTKATDCSSDETICTDPEVCQTVTELDGKTITICSKDTCTNSDQCADNAICTHYGSTSKSAAYCIPGCDPKSTSTSCPPGEKCENVKRYILGYSKLKGLCLPDQEANKADIFEGCTTASDCRKDLTCVEIKGDNGLENICLPSCQTFGPNEECKAINPELILCRNYNNGVKACSSPIYSAHLFTQRVGEVCGLISPNHLALCKDLQYTVCLLEHVGDKKGRCIKYSESYCDENVPCEDTSKTCTEVVSKGHDYLVPSFTYSVCL